MLVVIHVSRFDGGVGGRVVFVADGPGGSASRGLLGGSSSSLGAGSAGFGTGSAGFDTGMGGFGVGVGDFGVGGFDGGGRDLKRARETIARRSLSAVGVGVVEACAGSVLAAAASLVSVSEDGWGMGNSVVGSEACPPPDAARDCAAAERADPTTACPTATPAAATAANGPNAAAAPPPAAPAAAVLPPPAAAAFALP